jgi:preprotein translocase subunit SecG
VLDLSLDFILLIHVVKGAEAGSAFGSGASGTIFGSQGHSSFLTKSTTFMAILLACTSLLLTLMLRGNNVADKVRTLEQQEESRTIPVDSEDK